MPRRRATKQVNRAKPKLPPGDTGTEMPQEVRLKKLDTLLKEFDMEVDGRLAQMQREAKAMCKIIQRAVNMEIFKMPVNFKKMTVGEFFSIGGSFNQQAIEDFSHEVESLTSCLDDEATAATDTSQSENEENETAPKPTRTARRGRGKKATTATAAKTTRPRRGRGASKTASDTDDETPVPTRRSTRSRRGTTRSQYETPAANTGANGLVNTGLNTPMVTPKFDPRCPLTPAVMREAKRGETIMSMSGSPISNPSRLDCEKPGLLTLGNGKVIDVGSEDAAAIDNLAMDETTRKNILMLQENLAKILQHSTENT